MKWLHRLRSETLSSIAHAVRRPNDSLRDEDRSERHLIHSGKQEMTDLAKESIESKEKEAVAYRLMQHIGALESQPDAIKNDREYWLTLYRRCLRVVSGRRTTKRSTPATPGQT